MKITPLHGSGQDGSATNNGRVVTAAAVHPPHDRAGPSPRARNGQPCRAAPDRAPSTPPEMRFWMEARRFLTRGTLDRALDLLASAADAAEATEPTAGAPKGEAPRNAAVGKPPSGGRPETDASGRTGGAAKAVPKPPDASVDRSIMRNTFARVASYLIGGEDVMAMPLGRVRTLARERTEQGHVLAAIASRYSHLPHTTVVGELLPPSELEQIVEQARKDAENAV